LNKLGNISFLYNFLIYSKLLIKIVLETKKKTAGLVVPISVSYFIVIETQVKRLLCPYEEYNKSILLAQKRQSEEKFKEFF